MSLATEKLSIPVTVKIRVFEDVNKTVEYAKMLEKAGAKVSRSFAESIYRILKLYPTSHHSPQECAIYGAYCLHLPFWNHYSWSSFKSKVSRLDLISLLSYLSLPISFYDEVCYRPPSPFLNIANLKKLCRLFH